MNRPVFAERIFYIKGNNEKKVALRILGPSDSNPDFLFHMDGVDSDKYPNMFGGCDSLQAFMQTAWLLKMRVDEINREVFEGKLRWTEDDDEDLGLYEFTKMPRKK